MEVVEKLEVILSEMIADVLQFLMDLVKSAVIVRWSSMSSGNVVLRHLRKRVDGIQSWQRYRREAVDGWWQVESKRQKNTDGRHLQNKKMTSGTKARRVAKARAKERARRTPDTATIVASRDTSGQTVYTHG